MQNECPAPARARGYPRAPLLPPSDANSCLALDQGATASINLPLAKKRTIVLGCPYGSQFPFKEREKQIAKQTSLASKTVQSIGSTLAQTRISGINTQFQSINS